MIAYVGWISVPGAKGRIEWGIPGARGALKALPAPKFGSIARDNCF
jgi:hypothetical protein